jgi:hypothetical protein
VFLFPLCSKLRSAASQKKDSQKERKDVPYPSLREYVQWDLYTKSTAPVAAKAVPIALPSSVGNSTHKSMATTKETIPIESLKLKCEDLFGGSGDS